MSRPKPLILGTFALGPCAGETGLVLRADRDGACNVRLLTGVGLYADVELRAEKAWFRETHQVTPGQLRILGRIDECKSLAPRALFDTGALASAKLIQPEYRDGNPVCWRPSALGRALLAEVAKREKSPSTKVIATDDNIISNPSGDSPMGKRSRMPES